MGYTHSWIRKAKLDSIRFAGAVDDCRQVCEASRVPLKGIEGLVEPVFREYMVAFVGGGEWFIVQAACGDSSPERPARGKVGWHFGSCKTEHLPCDICVQACLIVFNHHFELEFQVGSDGGEADWAAARALCQPTLGYGEAFRLDTQSEASRGP